MRLFEGLAQARCFHDTSGLDFFLHIIGPWFATKGRESKNSYHKLENLKTT